MPGIFNFPYLQVNSILKVSEQPYMIGANHEYYQTDTNMLLYVKTGQILLYAGKSYILNPNELIIIPANTQITFTASVPDTIALHVILQVTSDHLDMITEHIFKIKDEQLLKKINLESQRITFLRSRKPDMTYDLEIGNYFTVLCALLYSDVTRLLLSLSEAMLKLRLPQSIEEAPSASSTDIWSTTRSQLDYAKTASGTLYKNLLVDRIITYMKANLDKNLSINLISQEFLVGSSNLKKIFKQETGTSIITYFKTLKMTSAKLWVEEHQVTYTDISNKLGFSSVHHFSTAFKKYTGLSPTNYYESLQIQSK